MKLSILFSFAFFVFLSATNVHAKRNFGDVVDDAVIASKLRVIYMKDETVAAKDIAIKVLNGVVTLKGELENQDQINRAIELAEQQKGVKEVKAYLVLGEFGELLHQKDPQSNRNFGIFKSPSTGNTKKDKKKKMDLEEKDLMTDQSASSNSQKDVTVSKNENDTTAQPNQEQVNPDLTKELEAVKPATTQDGPEDFKEFDGY